MAATTFHNNGQFHERVACDLDRDHYLASKEAKARDLIDEIICPSAV